MRRIALIGMFGACLSLLPGGGDAAFTGINGTKHNFSVSGTGTYRATSETRICVFCHTPHNATPDTPLWNRVLGSGTYTVYTSSTLKSAPSQLPTGATKLCLSCHDGTTAIGAVVWAGVDNTGAISMRGGVTTVPSTSNFGDNLSNHHPVSFSYATALPNDQLVATPPPNLVFGDVDSLECTTCHDPHDDSNGKFLVMSNRYSALCVSCHNMTGWAGSDHAVNTNLVDNTILPVAPKTYPNWATVAEWGCEVCHTPHFAPGAESLLNYTSSDFCLLCHGDAPDPIHTAPAVAGPAGKTSFAAQASLPAGPGRKVNIRRQVKKVSSHGGPSGVGDLLHHPKESPRSAARHVVCVDCHNPHVARNQRASAPKASGAVRGVRGVDRNGMEIPSVTYEYELCFRCHGDYSPGVPDIPRVVNTTNARLAFDASNPSYHPVVATGRNRNVPSIPSSYEPTLNASNQIYCTDCHRDDTGGSKGPHGSSFSPILRERYETADGTRESGENYALCYRCHNRSSILGDASFRKKTAKTTASGGGHSGHLAKGVPCSACHDPHGIPDDRRSGSHTHLINFDTRIAAPVSRAPNNFPKFNDTGTFSGNCTLVCHGVNHNNLSYP